MLALETLAESYNLYGTQATTHPCTPMLIQRTDCEEVGLNSGNNVMGNYFARTRRSAAQCVWRS
jgi:hypothetical protein